MFTIKKDGSITVDTASEAADVLRLLNGHAQNPTLPMPVMEDFDTVSAADMLRAGGLKYVRKSTLAVYSAMLARPGNIWTADGIGKKVKTLSKQAAGQQLFALHKRGIIARVGFGQYKIK